MTAQKHDVQSPYRHVKALLLAGALTVVAASVAHATDAPGSPGDDNGRSGVSTADDTGPGNPGDNNGRSGVSTADDTGPGNPGDHNGRSGVSTAGDTGPGGIDDNNGRTAELLTDGGQGAVWIPVAASPASGIRLATEGPGNPTDSTGRSVS